MNAAEPLTYYAETDGVAAWVHRRTGNVLELRPNGVYYLCRHEGDYDYPVVLGQLPPADTSRLLEKPTSDDSQRLALDLIGALEEQTAS